MFEINNLLRVVAEGDVMLLNDACRNLKMPSKLIIVVIMILALGDAQLEKVC